ncbi:tryptophan-rich sensory protein [Spirosoma utsteinense]|uniref:Tryptophan-rich sensory protein n=1 Tax=Spirosoma utsteinense TaxID=2585773 RepID=A0ABR6W0C6_9BACT|nr:tryptophan-rich sensory protein [Spirosoma utsteinense]MBC3783792.1 tryptophan-rich sensory protein [Spirosoma utsteinense]MBC3790064.1 tryptophan-rich sensory protein [Spirosoma utsteinense]
MKNDKLRQFFVVFSVVTMIVMNYLSNARVFGGLTNGDISNKYHTLITPAGYAFAIWGIIFLGLLAFAIYQALPSQRTNVRFRAIGWLVVINTLCNAIWSPLFNNELIGIALIVILVMLFTAAMIEQRLLMRPHIPIVAPDLDATLPESPASSTETWLARIPFSIYFGWLTVATILNVAVYLTATDFSLMNLSEQTWAIGILIVGLVVGAWLFNRYRSVAYILVFAWAYVAIAAEQSATGSIRIAAYAGAIGAVLLAVSGFVSRKTPSYS